MNELPIRILLIEDNPGDVRLVKERLAKQGIPFEMDWADLLGEGLKKIKTGKYDVVLLDLGLPDSSRQQTLCSVVEQAPEAPIVVLTGSRDETLGMESVQNGAQDYLAKELIGQWQIMRSIRYAMERKKAEVLLRKARDELELRVRERTAELQSAMEKLQEEYHQRAMLEREIVRVGERERHRIGRDLHDMLGSKLTGVAFLCKALEGKLDSQGRPEAQDAATIVMLMNEAISQTRALARGLRQVEFRDEDLAKALRTLLDDIEQVFHVRCELEMDFTAHFSDPAKASHLYQIVNESITNAVKHASPTRIVVQMRDEAGQGRLIIRNDGKSLPAEYQRSTGMGIQTMVHRAKIIDGRLDIQADSQGGTVVTCTFPLS